MTMFKVINMTLGLLNTIQVSGENNLNALCAAIKNLKNLSNEILKARKDMEDHDADDGQGKDV